MPTPSSRPDNVYMTMAGEILVALSTHESSCDLRRQTKSQELFGHRGAYVPSEAPTDEGRILYLAGFLDGKGL